MLKPLGHGLRLPRKAESHQVAQTHSHLQSRLLGGKRVGRQTMPNFGLLSRTLQCNRHITREDKKCKGYISISPDYSSGGLQ